MSELTSIQLKKSLVRELKKMKAPSQTYDALLREMCKVFKKVKGEDSFLMRIQQEKMREIWDNKYDEVWDHVQVR